MRKRSSTLHLRGDKIKGKEKLYIDEANSRALAALSSKRVLLKKRKIDQHDNPKLLEKKNKLSKEMLAKRSREDIERDIKFKSVILNPSTSIGDVLKSISEAGGVKYLASSVGLTNDETAYIKGICRRFAVSIKPEHLECNVISGNVANSNLKTNNDAYDRRIAAKVKAASEAGLMSRDGVTLLVDTKRTRVTEMTLGRSRESSGR